MGRKEKISHPIYGILYNDDNRLGIACSLEKLPLFLLPNSGLVENWKPLVLELQDGIYGDYLPAPVCLNSVMSPLLRDILQREASPHDVLQWLDVTLRTKSEERKYYTLHFPEPHNVYDREHSVYVGKNSSRPAKPAFVRALCEQYNVFACPKNYGSFFIRQHVKEAIEAAGCTGIEFWGRPEY